ncbi:MAG: CRISPR-associated DxTHG motif protein [Flavobacteriia bacterium]|nr:CRISPR-associated DxTHG motif protein [Flavobacteriia bacterium]
MLNEANPKAMEPTMATHGFNFMQSPIM